MPRRKKSRRSGKKKLPLAVIAGIAPAAHYSITWAMKGNFDAAQYAWTGYSMERKRVEPERLIQTYAPIAIGIVAHKTLGKMVNRYIPKWIPVGL